MLPLLHDDGLRSQAQDRAGRSVRERLPGQLARLLLVDEQNSDALQRLQEVRALAVDPVVHRIAEDQARLRELLEDLPLENGIDVRQKDVSQPPYSPVQPRPPL